MVLKAFWFCRIQGLRHKIKNLKNHNITDGSQDQANQVHFLCLSSSQCVSHEVHGPQILQSVMISNLLTQYLINK